MPPGPASADDVPTGPEQDRHREPPGIPRHVVLDEDQSGDRAAHQVATFGGTQAVSNASLRLVGLCSATVSQLYRSNDQSVFRGVCAGLAERYGWEPAWVRIAFIAGSLLGGPGILVYVVMVLVVPPKPELSDGNKRELRS